MVAQYTLYFSEKSYAMLRWRVGICRRDKNGVGANDSAYYCGPLKDFPFTAPTKEAMDTRLSVRTANDSGRFYLVSSVGFDWALLRIAYVSIVMDKLLSSKE
ncbi:unnamed protein product, partial [Iphiclides podalirius]